MKYIVVNIEESTTEGRVWSSVTPFDSLEDSKKFLKSILRDNWGMIETVSGTKETLDKLPGFKSPEDCLIKHATTYFSDDEMQAWTEEGEEHMFKKIEIHRLGKEGETICTI